VKDHQDRIGQQIGGYRLLRLLGRGSFGAVYLAQSTPQQEPVALKLLQMPLSGREEFKSFLNEARTMRLQHPHIVPLLDFGTSREDLPYLVMEYVQGGTLRERYPRGTHLPLTVVCHYISQLASALYYAHEHRVIHRDVKPENMLLRTDGMVLLSDFGIARTVEQSATASMANTAGTPAYIAPEQSYGKPQPASDQYALAVVAYEWLAGNRPFAGTPMEIVVQHRLDAPPSLHILRQDLPTEAEQVIARALAKRPEERFATIEQFAQALNVAFQQASKANFPLMPTAPTPSLSALTTPAPALPQRMAVQSQAETPPMPGREPPVPPQPTPSLDGRARSLSMPGRGPAETPLAHQLTAYETPSSRPLPNEPITIPIPVSSKPMQPRGLWRPVPPWQRMVLAALALVVIAGGLIAYFALSVPAATLNTAHQATASTLIHQATANAMATARGEQTATAQAQATVQAQAAAQARIIAAAQAQGKPQLLWTFATGGPILSSPTVVNGVVYVGSNDYTLYAINTVTGMQEWTFATRNNILSLPAVVNGIVYTSSTDTRLYAVDATTGQQKWAFAAKGGMSASPVVVNGIVYISSGDGKLYAIDATNGQLKWAFAAGGPIWSSPIVANGVVYVGSIDHKLYAINAANGQQKWAFATADLIPAAPTISNGLVYVVSNDYKLYAIDVANGQQKWAFVTGGPIWSSPTVANGVVYVGSHDHNLYAIDAANGQQKWAFMTGNKVWSSPTVVNGVVYVGSMDHKLYAIDATNGQQKWTFTTGDAIKYSSPIVVNGVVYIGSNDHKLYAIAIG
jgi:outer membrane protein assembly factor BamB/serine/threonine protein kinase